MQDTSIGQESVAASTRSGAARHAERFMTFRLGEEKYAFGILDVREIIGSMDITPVPKTRAFFKGVINLRGKVIPVVDLRLAFGMPEASRTEHQVIIVLQFESQDSVSTFGILVDEVLEVVAISRDEVEPPPVLMGRAEEQCVTGVGKISNSVCFLLDLSTLLQSNKSHEA